jgi:hypothetical protein
LLLDGIEVFAQVSLELCHVQGIGLGQGIFHDLNIVMKLVI